MHTGDDNPDGWGVGWYELDEPEVYRTTIPVWDDADFAARARTIEARAFLAAARRASPGSVLDARNNAPFRSGRWLCSLNGLVRGFHDGVGDVLRARVSAARVAALEGDTDSEVLFAMVLDRIDDGAPPDVAVATVVHEVRATADAALNLLLTDGDLVVASRSGRSLFTRGGTVASEPLDHAPGWTEVHEGAVVTVVADGLDGSRPIEVS